VTIKQRCWLPFFTVLTSIMLVACGTSTSSNTNAATSSTTSTSKPTTSNTSATPAGTACATTTITNGQQAYAIVPNKSQASYQVTEKFLNRPLPNVAVGKTNSIQGGFLLQATGQPAISNLKITVNLQTLTSDSDRRDNAIRQHWLESDNYPLATFVVKNPQTVASTFTQGQTVNFKLTGDMTIHNTTRQETFNVTGKLNGQTITGTAKTLLYMKNYGFDAPSLAGILNVTDGVTVTLNFTAQQTNCLPKM
jgi:polyisoprenoid-binding protein YceI